MFPVSEIDIENARNTVDSAREKREKLELALASLDGDLSRANLDSAGTLRTRHEQAELKLRVLTETRARQQKAASDHEEALTAAAGWVSSSETQLIKARAALLASIDEAGVAMRKMVRLAAYYDDSVRLLAGNLVEAGLPMVDSEGINHPTGGGVSGTVILSGQWWQPLDAGALFSWVSWGAVRSVLGSQHPRTNQFHDRAGFQSLSGRRDGLLSSVKLPEPATLKAVVRPPSHVRTAAKPESTVPYLERVARENALMPQPSVYSPKGR